MIEIQDRASCQPLQLTFSRPLASFELVDLLRQLERSEHDAPLSERLSRFTLEHGLELSCVAAKSDRRFPPLSEIRNLYL